MENAQRAEILKAIQDSADVAENNVGKTPLNAEDFEPNASAEEEASEAGKLARLGTETSLEIQKIFERRGLDEADRSDQLQEIKEEFLAQAKLFAPHESPETALKMLAEQLKEIHDSYFEAAKSGVNDAALSRGLETRAAEIDAFRRSLGKEEVISGSESAVTSEAGQAFLGRLKSGEFPDPMLAQAALAEELSHKVGREVSEEEFKTLFRIAGDL